MGGMMEGDESYAGARSWRRMEKAIHDLTGLKYVFPTHQGRAAERILYGYLGGKGKFFISNTHFDTTRANIEFSGAEAIDIPCAESNNTQSDYPFKGNMDTKKLEELILKHKPKNIGGVILTVTNNSGGGQPVSMENAKLVSAVCKKYKVKLFLDCCRVAENSFFIHQKEKGYENKTLQTDCAENVFTGGWSNYECKKRCTG